MLITLSSVRGSPGVTSWALLLAAAWPAPGSPTRVLLEADCSGGVLGARYQLGVDPGAVSLLSACRHGSEAIDPAAHGRHLDHGLWVVPGPEVAERAHPAWEGGANDAAARLGDDDRLWVADCGRVGPRSPLRPMTDAAVLNLVVCGPSVEDLVQVPARLAAIGGEAPAAVLLVGRPAHSQRELERFLGGVVVWVVPAPGDLPQRALAAVQGGRARRTSLWRAAVDLAAEVSMVVGRTRRDRARTPAPAPTHRGPKLPDVSPTLAAAMDAAARARLDAGPGGEGPP